MNKRKRVEACVFGGFMAVFSVLQSLFTSDDYTFYSIAKFVVIALIVGLISGIGFTWLVGVLTNSKLFGAPIKVQLEEDENVLFETPANHFKGIEAVGGKLFLTNERLIFKSHKINFQNHQLSIRLNNINRVDGYKTLGIVNNGISIHTIQNKTEKFVVTETDEWVKHLIETKSAYSSDL